MSGHHVLSVVPEWNDQIATAIADRGHRVTTAATPTEAVAIALSDPIDRVVVSDELGDELETLQSVLAEHCPRLPVVSFSPRSAKSVGTKANEQSAALVHADRTDALEDLVRELETAEPPVQTDPTARSDSSRSSTRNSTAIEDGDPTVSGLSDDQLFRAIDHAPVGISLTDPSKPDNPLIYVNDAWKEICGYERSEVIGENPRLLQGLETDEETVAEIREAIENDEPITTRIKNYTADGSPFWNELTVAPVRDEIGRVRHYVGFQNDVTHLHATEELAEQRRTDLAHEVAVLERILSRVSGLLYTVTQILVTETNRRAVESRICEVVAETDGYIASWFGTVDEDDSTLTIRTAHGVSVNQSEPLALESVPRELVESQVDGAVRSIDLSAVQDERLVPEAGNSEALLVVPLQYSPKRYGLFCVYTDDADILDNREKELFESIGNTIAAGLHVIETVRMQTTKRVHETRFEIADPSFVLADIAARMETDIEYTGITGGGEGSGYELYLQASGPIDHEINGLTGCESIESARVITESETSVTFSVTATALSPFVELSQYGASVVDAAASPECAEIVVESPAEQDVRSIFERLESMYETVRLVSQCERDRRRKPQQEFSAQLDTELTNRQQTAIKKAYFNGYFEWPRPVDGSEVAETMDISRQTFHQHLRAAEKKLIGAYLGE
ncbi:bacterio-opsin activator domain-containing protein [Halalkalirubrum salinum]|uniref:bacterio-opsin activator domain-containing protein n=1 Tax=Halalkalirubrum salinum TaxID=2563889 RepID=UPI0014857534|nr:bacterio-opsin activator domain-containing protein [Halalkalirubrum salinum]